MILELDIGNTRMKWRCLHEGIVRGRGSVIKGKSAEWVALIEKDYRPRLIRLACVANKELLEWVGELAHRWRCELQVAQTGIALGDVRCGYDDPSSMGVDRWLAVVAAYYQFKQACVVVDAGSAITVDLVRGDGQHIGGYIVPGFGMMEKALSSGTSKINVALGKLSGIAPGVSTQEAVSHGCLLMIKAMVDSAAKDLACIEPSVQIVVTGGDAGSLIGVLGGKVEFVPELVMDGLNIAVP